MELSLPKFSTILLTLLLLIIATVPAQMTTTPCTVSMITSFTPCFNFITGSTANGGNSPTQDCCDSLNTLITTSLDCTCLLISANIPFPLHINRTLALTLPRVCNTARVPVQCKASKGMAMAPTKILPSPVAAPTEAPMQPKSAPRTQRARPILSLPFSNSTPASVTSNIKPLQILIITSIVIWVLVI